MVDLKKLHEKIIDLIDKRSNKMMVIERARSASEIQFNAWRRLYFSELGRKGLQEDISALFFEVSIAEMAECEDAIEQELAE